VLHVDELTYSVSGPLEEQDLAGGVLESYHTLSGALVQALRSLGVLVQVSGQGKPARGTPNPVCFEVPSTYEITAEGRKLIGSAQARRKEGVLQHGSLPLHGDLRRILQVIHFPDETARHSAGDLLLARAATLAGVLGRQVSWEQAAEAFCAAFQDVLSINLRAESLSPRELARAEQLLADKYSRREWTEKKG
jgi:lipoate-protein ligase A